jgi:hypothetical protein
MFILLEYIVVGYFILLHIQMQNLDVVQLKDFDVMQRLSMAINIKFKAHAMYLIKAYDKFKDCYSLVFNLDFESQKVSAQ